MKVTLATCENLSAGSEDDQLLQQQLIKLGASVESLPWTQIKPNQFDVVVLRATWDYHMHLAEFKKWTNSFRDSKTLLLNCAEIVHWNCDKKYLSELQDESVSIVPSLFVEKDHDISELITEIELRGWSELVVKPTVSATAYLTFRCEVEELEEKLAQILPHSTAMIQPFLPSIASDGEISLIMFNGEKPEYSHAVLKTAVANEFRVQANFGGQVESFEPSPELIQFALNCVRIPIDDWIYARVDIVNFKSEPLLGELEMIEPNLFFEQRPLSAMRLAQIILSRAKEFKARG